MTCGLQWEVTETLPLWRLTWIAWPVAACNSIEPPDKLGVWTLPIHFREAKPDAVTLPQWFRKFGYTAVSHGKIYHNPTPDPQSWSEPIRKRPPLPYVYPKGTREIVKNAKQQLPKKDWRKKSLRPPSTAAPDLADDKLRDGAQTSMAIEDLRRLGKQDQPFFLAMGYIRPHLAFVAPKKYWDMHDQNNKSPPTHLRTRCTTTVSCHTMSTWSTSPNLGTTKYYHQTKLATWCTDTTLA